MQTANALPTRLPWKIKSKKNEMEALREGGKNGGNVREEPAKRRHPRPHGRASRVPPSFLSGAADGRSSWLQTRLDLQSHSRFPDLASN